MRKVIFILALALTGSITFAQDTPLEISGSADVYYKYDFAKASNIGTSFASDHNSVSLGMIDIALKKTTGKTSFVGEVSFGPRGQYQSIPNGDGTDTNSFHIQNLYVTYKATDKLSFTAGYMGTFIGYEVISPLANFHYSTSYLFTNGPFQNAGIKANYAISDKVGLMVGGFNSSWNFYSADPMKGLNAIGAQLSLIPTEGVSAYLNFMDGSESGTIVDLTASFQLSEKFKLGLNAADWSGIGDDEGYTGFALYPSVAVTENFGLGLRAEYFKAKESATALYGIGADNSVTAFTLSANLKAGGLTVIPEFRLDSAKDDNFFKSDMITPTKSASQASIALVYGF
jgi:hypothetical protein